MKKIAIGLSLAAFMACKKESSETISSKPLEVSTNEMVNYIEYCNSRFKACLDYPSNFGAQPEPANGDGRTFVNEPDSAQIVMFGFLDQGNEGIAAQLKLIEEQIDIKTVDSLPNGYLVRGLNKETKMNHIEKILIKPDETNQADAANVIYSLQFEYPDSKKAKFANYWEKISKRFE